MIEAGANVNSTDVNKGTALMDASSTNRDWAVTTLIEAGTNVNLIDVHGVTALMKAASCRTEHCVRILIGAGAAVNASDSNAVTPLMRAAFTDNNNSVKALIEAGANVNARDVDGITALMHATFNFREIYLKAWLEVAAGKTPRFFPDPKKNTLNRPPNDVKISVKDGEIALLPMSSPVLRYAKTVDEINKTKQELVPNYHKELSLPIISGVVTTAYSVFAKSGQLTMKMCTGTQP